MDAAAQRILKHFETAESIKDYWGETIDAGHVQKYFETASKRFELLLDVVCEVVPTGGRVLEVGPAYGSTLLNLQDRGYVVSACELPECIPAYSDVLKKNNVAVTPWDLHKSDCPLKSEKFDVVIASEVIEHLQLSVTSALSKLTSVLHPGGSVVVTTPNLYRLSNVKKLLRGQNIIEAFGDEAAIKNGVVVDNRTHPREPTMRDLVEGAKACGLQVIQTKYFNAGSASLSRRWMYGVLPRRLRGHALLVGRK